MKTILIILILLSGLSIGSFAKYRLNQREKSLEKCILLLETIETQVSFSKKDIQKILTELSSRLKLDFVNNFTSDNSDLTLEEKWKTALLKSSSKDCLKSEDVDVLISFSALLGVTDNEGQLKNCRIHKELISKLLLNAREENKDKGKIIPALSFLSSLALSVLII